MDFIKIHTSFGGDVYLRHYPPSEWEVEIYTSNTFSERHLLVPIKHFKSKSGAMGFIKRTIIKYASIMGEIKG
jgi:hypothetical protein